MAKKHRPVPGGKKALTRKARIVHAEDPSLTPEQVIGKSAGILRHRAKKKKKRRRKTKRKG